MNLEALLHKTRLFRRCNQQQIRAIASVCVEHDLEPGTLISRQTYLGSTFFVVQAGEALVRRINENGEDRPVGVLRPGDSYGVTSLFVGEPRDASVLATSPMRIWSLRRDDFEELLREYPELWRTLTIPPELVARLRTPTADWLEADESLVFISRRHWIVPAKPMLVTSLAFILLMVVLVTTACAAGEFPAFTVPVTALYLLVLIWFWLDWRNDYFAVTTSRIVHHEHVLFLFEAREEAPIDRVQNVHLIRGFFANLFNYGDVEIETAASAGMMLITRIPAPEAMRDAIFAQSSRWQAVNRAAHRLQIQDELAAKLGASLASPDSMPVPEVPFALSDQNALQFRRRGLAHLLDKLASWGLIPRTRAVSRDGVIWRKHWIFMLSSTIVPFLLAGFFGAAFLVLTINTPAWAIVLEVYLRILAVVGFVAAYLWFFWRLNDWANDLYIVTNDRIIDIERHPLFLAESRREASLGVIQNVAFRQGNLASKVFNYGDVLVQTAGPGTFTFTRVANPREVQREVFRRMELFRRLTKEREARELRGELSDWFGVYSQMPTSQSDRPIRIAD